MYRVNISTPAVDIDDIERDLRGSPALLATALKRASTRLASRWKEALQVEPPPAQRYYPMRYKSERQRRKVHAIRRERGGGAYDRTHELVRRWNVTAEADKTGGFVTVRNTAPEAIFVYGDVDTPRQPMFDAALGGVPWLDPQEVNRAFAVQFDEIIQQVYVTVFDPKAGIR